MARLQSQILIALALAAPVFGCRAAVVVRRDPPVSTSEAPMIRLAGFTHQSSSSDSQSETGFASLDSDTTEVTFVDLRPDVERKYYPGSTRLTQWRDAVTMFPMESFEPGIAQQILQKVSRNSAQSVSRPVPARIELTSFRFAQDRRSRSADKFKAEYASWSSDRLTEEYRQDQEREAYDRRRSDDPFRDNQRLASEMTGRGIKWMFWDVPMSANRERPTPAETRAAPQSIPMEITDGLTEGLNCQMMAVVHFRHENQSTWQKQFDVRHHADCDDSQPVLQQAAAVVEKVIDQFCRQIRAVNYQGDSPMQSN